MELKKVLLDSGLVTESEYSLAEKDVSRSGRSVLEVLVGKGGISEENARDYLAGFFGVPTIDLEKVAIDKKALERVPESFAKAKGLIVFAFDEKTRTVKVAMRDPEDLGTIEYLAAKLDCSVDTSMASARGLRHGLNQYQQSIGEDFNKTIEDNIQKTLSETGVSDTAKLAEAVPVVTILDSIIEHAATQNASDIHFEPFEGVFVVRYRIDGIMHEVVRMPDAIGPIVLARIKVMCGMQMDIHNAPQDGRFRFTLDGGYLDVRVSILPSFYGEKGEMRLLQASNKAFSLSELGFADKDLAQIEDSAQRPHGMILVTGPTGSGKTTTLYAVLHVLNTPEVSINTIEDPIEYNIPGVTQTQVNQKAGVTFATGLRALVRQNPNIIMIGEIRDSETADISVNAALTGHLVLSTLHTNDAPTAIPRLIDMGVQPFLIASTLDMVIAQRLVRKICSVCVKSYSADATVQKQIAQQAKLLGIPVPATPNLLFRGNGCNLCGHTGYRGQLGIFEVFRVNDVMRDLILKQSPTNEIRKQAVKSGLTFMFEDGLKKAQAGVTTLEEVLRVTKE